MIQLGTLYLLVPSADNFCKQFDIGIPERIFQKVDFEKKSADGKKHAKFLRMQRVNLLKSNKGLCLCSITYGKYSNI